MKNPEEVFVGGLLHDIGKVVLYVKWPDVGQQITATRKDGSRSLMETERELFAVTHADVGGWLATALASPTTLRRPILHHRYAVGSPKSEAADRHRACGGCAGEGPRLRQPRRRPGPHFPASLGPRRPRCAQSLAQSLAKTHGRIFKPSTTILGGSPSSRRILLPDPRRNRAADGGPRSRAGSASSWRMPGLALHGGA